MRRSGSAPVVGLLVAGIALMPHALAGQDGTGGAPVPDRSDCSVSADDFRTVTLVLERWAERRRLLTDVPGMALGVVCGKDRMWTRGFGLADRERRIPATDTTLFRIASISKLFTGLAVMQLRDEGRLGLDDPVSEHLPWFRPTNAEDFRPVTIRHLLTHTSGLPTNSSATDFNRMTQPMAGVMIASLGTQQLLYAPGSTMKYSNLGFAVLGQLVETVGEQSYERWVQERLFAPLSMRQTLVHPRAETVQATGHHPRDPGRTRRRADYIHLAAFTPAGGMATTARDLARFAQFALMPDRVGAPVLRPGTVREMQELHHGVAASGGTGLAWAVDHGAGGRRVYHGGGLPTQASHLEIDLDGGFAALALTNAMDADPATYAREAIELLRLAVSADADGACRDRRADHSRYIGRYTWHQWEVWIITLGECLWMIEPVGLTDPLAGRPSATVVQLQRVSPALFRADRGWVAGELLVFEADGNDPAIRLHLPGLMLRRVGDLGR